MIAFGEVSNQVAKEFKRLRKQEEENKMKIGYKVTEDIGYCRSDGSCPGHRKIIYTNGPKRGLVADWVSENCPYGTLPAPWVCEENPGLLEVAKEFLKKDPAIRCRIPGTMSQKKATGKRLKKSIPV
jgi:hypothetical protein